MISLQEVEKFCLDLKLTVEDTKQELIEGKQIVYTSLLQNRLDDLLAIVQAQLDEVEMKYQEIADEYESQEYAHYFINGEIDTNY